MLLGCITGFQAGERGRGGVVREYREYREYREFREFRDLVSYES